MGALFKNLVFFVLAILALLVIAGVALMFLFDPNDYRDNIAAQVEQQTGRELVIEGDLELSLFPWFAVELGKTTLGNAPGFGEEPFVSFDEARLSIRLLPMLLRRELSVGSAVLDGFNLNLAVNRNGRSNWQDLVEASEAEPDQVTGEGEPARLDIGGVDISDAAISYRDDQLGESYRLTNFNLNTGRVASGEPLPLSGSFDFDLQPADLKGDFDFETTMLLDGDAGTVEFSDLEFTVLGVEIAADVEPFSYAGESTPTARVEVEAFSMKGLMMGLDIEPPVTADPAALEKVYGDAVVRLTPEAITLSDVTLVVDDTTFKGDLALDSGAAGTIRLNLAGDEIDLGRYMEPAPDAAGAGGESVPVEIPVDLIRAFNVRGNLTMQEALLSGMTFENARLGLNIANGSLRLHPVAADLFGGKYEGDVRINAASDTPVLSVNENVRDVNLGALAAAMFEQENVTGTINGTFTLSGRGADLGIIQRSLSGNMAMELADGALEGTDIWYELRRARAMLKKEPAPEPELPPRTRFSNISVSGPVKDGIFRSDNLFAELPYMQLTGKGKVDFPAAEIDYRMTARILERPEFATGATEEELKEFTEAVIPIKVTGSLLDPSVAPDIEKMLKDEAEEKIKDALFDKLLGGDEDAEGEAEAGEETEATGEKKKKKDRDKLKDALEDLIKN